MNWQDRPTGHHHESDPSNWSFRSAQDKAASIFLATFLLGCGLLIGFGWVIAEVIS